MDIKVGDWIVARTNRGEIQGIVSKINHKTVIVKMNIAGKHKFIKRRNHDILENFGTW